MTPDPADKPPFPRWLIRMDPALAAWETNALYEAFRRHRLRRPPRFLHRALVLMGSALLACAALIGGYMAFFTSFEDSDMMMLLPPFLVAAYAGLLMALLPQAYPFFRRHPKEGREKLSTWVAGAFNISSVSRQATHDLWLAGATGREIAEAIQLEMREVGWRTQTVAAVLGFLLVVLFGFVRLPMPGFGSIGAAVGSILHVATVLLAAALAARCLFTSSRVNSPKALQARKIAWLRHVAVRRMILLIVLFLIAYFALLVVIGLSAIGFKFLGMASLFAFAWETLSTPSALGIAWRLGFILLWWMFWRELERVMGRYHAKLVRDLDTMFPVLVARVVEKDADVPDWKPLKAGMRYGG